MENVAIRSLKKEKACVFLMGNGSGPDERLQDAAFFLKTVLITQERAESCLLHGIRKGPLCLPFVRHEPDAAKTADKVKVTCDSQHAQGGAGCSIILFEILPAFPVQFFR